MTFTGYASLWAAIAADKGASLWRWRWAGRWRGGMLGLPALVIANGLRLLRASDPEWKTRLRVEGGPDEVTG